MFTARKKILKEKNAEPDVFEESVAQVRCCAAPCNRRQHQPVVLLVGVGTAVVLLSEGG